MMKRTLGTLLRSGTALVLAMGLASLGTSALAQAYPSKTIRLIVGYAPGGGGDTIARIVAGPLSQELGQAIIIENKPGAAGSLGAQAASMAQPDGYTLLVADRGMLVLNMGLFKKLPYDPTRDFVTIGTIAKSQFVLVGAASQARRNAAELIAEAKAKPGKLNYAVTATGSTTAMELLKQQAGVDIVGVPYKGAAPAVAAVLSAEVDLALLDIATALPHIRAGKLKAYGVTSTARLPWLPDTPPLAEAAGLPGYEAMTWVGLLAPRGTPPEVVNRLNLALNAALRAADVVNRFDTMGLETMPSTIPQFAARMREEQAVWPDRLRKWGMSAE